MSYSDRRRARRLVCVIVGLMTSCFLVINLAILYTVIADHKPVPDVMIISIGIQIGVIILEILIYDGAGE